MSVVRSPSSKCSGRNAGEHQHDSRLHWPSVEAPIQVPRRTRNWLVARVDVVEHPGAARSQPQQGGGRSGEPLPALVDAEPVHRREPLGPVGEQHGDRVQALGAGAGCEPGALLGDRLHLQPGDHLLGGLLAHTASAAARATSPRVRARARRSSVSRRVLRRSRTTTRPSTSTSVTSPRPAANTSSAGTSCTGVR